MTESWTPLNPGHTCLWTSIEFHPTIYPNSSTGAISDNQQQKQAQIRYRACILMQASLARKHSCDHFYPEKFTFDYS